MSAPHTSSHPFSPSLPARDGTGRTLLLVLAVLASVGGLTLTHEPGSDYGWASLIPSLIVLVVAIATHRTLEALAIGALSGLIMLQPEDFVGELADISLSVMTNETIAWLILVCGLMGGFIAMLEKSGCTLQLQSLHDPAGQDAAPVDAQYRRAGRADLHRRLPQRPGHLGGHEAPH